LRKKKEKTVSKGGKKEGEKYSLHQKSLGKAKNCKQLKKKSNIQRKGVGDRFKREGKYRKRGPLPKKGENRARGILEGKKERGGHIIHKEKPAFERGTNVTLKHEPTKKGKGKM